ncbi:MAG: hypothetical protein AAF449_16215 [Myxococcota bacterium]
MDFATVIRQALREGWNHPEGVRWTYKALAEHARIHPTTVFRWVQGHNTPQYDTLRLALDNWGLSPERRKQLMLARDRSDRRAADVIASFPGGSDVKRRDFLATAGAVVIAPLPASATPSDRYEQLRVLIDGVDAISRQDRISALRRLYGQCTSAAARNGSRTDHLLSAMTGTVYAFALHHDDLRRARAIARRSSVAAEASGRNVARLWSAAAEAVCARKMDDPIGAIDAIEAVTHLSAERGTVPVFAFSCLAEAYGDLGDKYNVMRALDMGKRARQKAKAPDEFNGSMAFPAEQEFAHGAQALLGAGRYTEAIAQAEQSLELYSTAPDPYYMRKSCVTIAAAAVRIDALDQAREYADRALAFPVDRPLAPVFKPLQAALAHADAPRLAARVRESVALS